ncbi:hypothetical protein evm_011000 [Chilo suppressalis]|nr:hypothetical protein evm_011000 [Chilo suppressalis]
MSSSCTSDEECTDCSTDSREESSLSRWQAVDSGLTQAVLGLVFAWLEGASLARAGAACRAWRAAAACPTLWRRLLRPCPTRPTGCVSWREEYVRVHAGWELRARLSGGRGGAGESFLHAALAPTGCRLALTTTDANILIWELDAEEIWREVWSVSLRARGWESAERAEWARAGRRLLVAGPVALAQRWELIVLDESDGGWSVASRASCGGGAAGCWATRAARAYLALTPRRLAPRLWITTVAINAATQETQSEYAGVTAPLLHIFNEEEASITHVVVAEVPLQDASASDDECSNSDNEDYDSDGAYGLARVLLAGFGGAMGAVRAWLLYSLQPPPLLAGAGGAGDLRARASRRRAAAARDPPDPPDPPEPSEQQVRDMCTPPDAECRFDGTLIGLTVQHDGRAVWSWSSVGALSAWSLPQLRALRTLHPPDAAPRPALRANALHYVQPAIGRTYLATPEGALSGRVWVWGAASGSARRAPLPHAAPALLAAFPRTREHTMLVLATDYLYVWRSKATPQTSDCNVQELD